MRLTWFGHSSVKLETDSHSVYFDPYAGPEDLYNIASLILISRFNFDHCSISKIRKASNDSTHILGTSEVASEIYPCGVLHPGETKQFNSLEVSGVPVINNRITHSQNAVGFILHVEDKSVYFMADSDYFPDLQNVNPDVLFISVGGTYTASAKEAAKTASLIAPKLAIPIHWGSINGTHDDALLFKELTDVPVKILRPGGSLEL